jgi:hypothetical protein
MYSVFYLKRNPNYTHEPLHETNGNIKFLQPHRVVTADALLQIGTTVILAAKSLDEHMPQTNTSCLPKLFYQPMHRCPIPYFLVRIRIAKCSTNSVKRFVRKMFKNIYHVRTCTAFAQLV